MACSLADCMQQKRAIWAETITINDDAHTFVYGQMGIIGTIP